MVREFNPPGTNDPTWIRKFALEGGYAIVSGDGEILQKWPNLIAYMGSGLISFFPPAGFQHRLNGFVPSGAADPMVAFNH